MLKGNPLQISRVLCAALSSDPGTLSYKFKLPWQLFEAKRQIWSLSFHLSHKRKPIIYSEIISNIQKNFKTCTENSHILFTQISQLLTFYHICSTSLSPYIYIYIYIYIYTHTYIYYHYSFLNHLSSNCRPDDSSLSLPPVSIFPKQRQSPIQPQYNQNQKTISIQLYHPVHRTLSSFSNYPNNVSFFLVQ